MKTELCWNRTQAAVGPACSGLAGNLTTQTPGNRTTGAKALHANRARVLPVLRVGTFEEQHTPSRRWALPSTTRPELQIPSPPVCRRPPGWSDGRHSDAHREKNNIIKCGQNSNYFFPLVGCEKPVVGHLGIQLKGFNLVGNAFIWLQKPLNVSHHGRNVEGGAVTHCHENERTVCHQVLPDGRTRQTEDAE